MDGMDNVAETPDALPEHRNSAQGEHVHTGVPAAPRMPRGWMRMERRWWLHIKYGGVARDEQEPWYGYPLLWSDRDRLGPFKNPIEAAEAVMKAIKALRDQPPPENEGRFGLARYARMPRIF